MWAKMTLNCDEVEIHEIVGLKNRFLKPSDQNFNFFTKIRDQKRI